jgi:hypothetical protein
MFYQFGLKSGPGVSEVTGLIRYIGCSTPLLSKSTVNMRTKNQAKTKTDHVTPHQRESWSIVASRFGIFLVERVQALFS